MADTTSQARPAFVAKIQEGDAGDNVKSLERLKIQNPEYANRAGDWRVLLDAFESDGGFKDGKYLWPYPREAAAEFAKRQAMARYHNYLETLIDIYVRFMFTQSVKRSSKNQDFNDWQAKVDGDTLSMDDLMKRTASVGLLHGHSGVLVDKTTDQPTGPTVADDKGKVVASVFTALAIPDWRQDRNRLKAVKLTEAAPAGDITEAAPEGDAAIQYLLWDETGWARFNAKGELVSWGMPDLGLVPLIVMRPKPSYTSGFLGRALVPSPNVIRAMYNRGSEEDQILRDQAFSLAVVEVPPDGNVDSAKKDLGDEVGSSKAVVVRGTFDYKTPDQSIPETIRKNITHLVEEMYRQAHIRYQRNSLDAESAEAIRLQHAELNEMLQGFSRELAAAELAIARAWFAWSAAETDASHGEEAFKAAEVKAEYPTEFFLDALITDLQAWAEAIAMDLGETMSKRIKKRAARRVEPDMPADVLKTIDAEIDAQTEEDLNPPAPGDPGGEPAPLKPASEGANA